MIHRSLGIGGYGFWKPRLRAENVCLHVAFRQRQALRRAGTGLPVELHRIAFSFNSNLKQEMNQGISEDRNFIKKDTRIKLKGLTVRRD